MHVTAEAILSLLATVRAGADDGLPSFEQSLGAFRRLGERDSEAKQQTNLADTLEYLGDSDAAAVHRYRALAIAEDLDNPRILHPILSEAADAALAASLPTAALLFQNRLVRLARQSGSALQIADALITRSTILRRSGRRAAAISDLREANAVAHRIEDPSTRTRVLADAAAAETFAYREADDRRAVRAATHSIELYRRLKFALPLAQLLLERGRARNRLGDAAGAESDFKSGISELEEQRRRVGHAALRITYFDRAERLFTELARSYLQRGAIVKAFDAIERSRARELLDSATGLQMEPLSAAAIQRRLPPRTTIVSFAVMPQSIITAVIDRVGVRAFETAITEQNMAARVDAISRAFEAEEPLPTADLDWLSESLIAPIRLPDDGRRIIFVPDQVLFRVPFAALSASPGRYLSEEHVIAVAPSATMFVRNAARDCSLALRSEGAILLVASAEKPAGFPSLEPLTHAPEETAAIAKLYPRSRTLLGSDPVAQSFLTLGREYAAIHFAGHSISDPRVPAASMLLVGEHGRLRASEIESVRLRNTRLVVLGACSTGIGKVHGGEGAMKKAVAQWSDFGARQAEQIS